MVLVSHKNAFSFRIGLEKELYFVENIALQA